MRCQSPLMKPNLTCVGTFKKRARSTDATTFKQNKWIVFILMAWTWFREEEFRLGAASSSLVSFRCFLFLSLAELYPIFRINQFIHLCVAAHNTYHFLFGTLSRRFIFGGKNITCLSNPEYCIIDLYTSVYPWHHFKGGLSGRIT